MRKPLSNYRAEQAVNGRSPDPRSALLTGILVGIGVIGFLDEAVLHQLLQWHTYYWGTDENKRILSDGLFHVASTGVLIWGALRFWRDRESWSPQRRPVVVVGLLFGGGGFNLFDGLVQHAIFHFHLVNERVCPTVHANNSLATCPADIPYEIVFDCIAAALLITGAIVVGQTRRRVPIGAGQSRSPPNPREPSRSTRRATAPGPKPGAAGTALLSCHRETDRPSRGRLPG